MKNEIIKNNSNVPSASTPREITVGNKSTYIENLNELHYTEKTYNISTTVNGNIITSNIHPDNSRYNLFVLEGEEFAKGYFIIPREKCLLHLDKEIESEYSLVESISLLKCLEYPCLFVNRNETYKTAGNNQIAYFGYLAEISMTTDGCKFIFSIVCSLPQIIFNRYTSDFNLKKSRGENELDCIHWSIKKKNLIKAVKKLGYNVAAYE